MLHLLSPFSEMEINHLVVHIRAALSQQQLHMAAISKRTAVTVAMWSLWESRCEQPRA